MSSSTVIVPLLSVSMVLNSWRRPLISSEDRQRATTRNAAFFNLVMPANCSHCACSACFFEAGPDKPSLPCAFHTSVTKACVVAKGTLPQLRMGKTHAGSKGRQNSLGSRPRLDHTLFDEVVQHRVHCSLAQVLTLWHQSERGANGKLSVQFAAG